MRARLGWILWITTKTKKRAVKHTKYTLERYPKLSPRTGPLNLISPWVKVDARVPDGTNKQVLLWSNSFFKANSSTGIVTNLVNINIFRELRHSINVLGVSSRNKWRNSFQIRYVWCSRFENLDHRIDHPRQLGLSELPTCRPTQPTDQFRKL